MTKHRATSKVDAELAALIVGNLNLVVGICFVGFLWTPAWVLGIGALLCIIMAGICSSHRLISTSGSCGWTHGR